MLDPKTIRARTDALRGALQAKRVDADLDRWLALDPFRMLEPHADALRSMKLLYLDCGIRDEWHLHLGMRLFAGRREALGIEHERQEFDDGHMNVQYRYDVTLPRIATAIGATGA